jgi:hypothetical protein
VLLLLTLSVASIIAAIIPQAVVELIHSTFVPGEITPLGRILLVIAAALVSIVSLLTMYAEIRPAKRKAVQLAQVKGGVAELSTESIASRIRQAVEGVADVRQVTPIVISHGKTVDISIGLISNPGVDVSRKSSEIVQLVRDLMERDIGVRVSKIRVNVKYDSLPSSQIQKA